MEDKELFNDLNNPQQFKKKGIRQMMIDNDTYESTGGSSNRIPLIILSSLFLLAIILITFFTLL
ncbi:hypothetical protein [Staphylococcus gallinarum]|uniref:hypothetical protein n=1 Tax=Staphylococcus gallinarum TaxID=1293 RepID=UPI00115E5256|nr:hypothetical protein [Staphylococcus gallinarum]